MTKTTAAQILERIKSFCSPTMDRGDAHGSRYQTGHILWASSEGFAIAAIDKALADVLEAERARIVALVERRMTEESGPDYGMLGAPARARIRSRNRMLMGLADEIALLKVESAPDFGGIAAVRERVRNQREYCAYHALILTDDIAALDAHIDALTNERDAALDGITPLKAEIDRWTQLHSDVCDERDAAVEAERAACEAIARKRERMNREAMERELTAGYMASADACQSAANQSGFIADAIAARGSSPRTGVYVASKTRHAPIWKGIRATGLPIISTWIDEAGPGESADLSDLWDRCIREASTAAAMILYRADDDELKGGWVELGAALTSGVPVFAVGIEGYTVAHHTGIVHCRDLPDAVTRVRAAIAALKVKSALGPNNPHVMPVSQFRLHDVKPKAPEPDDCGAAKGSAK